MKLKSLGYLTDLMFVRFDGEVLDRGDYICVRTPSNPRFFWGNYIAIPAAPTIEDWQHWQDTFKKEILDIVPGTHHIAIGWETPTQDLSFIKKLQSEGYTFDESLVLTANSTVKPRNYNSNIEVRPLKGDAEWELSTENQISTRDTTSFTYEAYAPFKRAQMAKYRAMVDAGIGHWMGAFKDGELVGDLGIFKDHNMARFQMVSTNPRHRRQGVCGTLVYETSQLAFKEMGIKSLVMVADENYHAARIYESVGFVPTEKLYGLYRWW